MPKPLIAFLICGCIGASWMWAYGWVETNHKEAGGTSQVTPAAQTPAPPSAPAKKPQISQDSKGDNSPNTAVIGNNNVVGNNNTVNTSDPKVLLGIDEIKKLLEERQGAKVSPDKLLEKYPLGYVIFGIDDTKSVLPYRNEMVKTWNIDWSVVQIQNETDNGFWLRLPDMRNKNEVGSLLNFSVGVPKKVGPFPQTIMRQGNVDLKGEILAITKGRIVFLLGFVDKGTPAP